MNKQMQGALHNFALGQGASPIARIALTLPKALALAAALAAALADGATTNV